MQFIYIQKMHYNMRYKNIFCYHINNTDSHIIVCIDNYYILTYTTEVVEPYYNGLIQD